MGLSKEELTQWITETREGFRKTSATMWVTCATYILVAIAAIWGVGILISLAATNVHLNQVITQQEQTITDWQGICALPLTSGEEPE